MSGTHRQDSSYGAFNQVVRALALDHVTAIVVQQRPPNCRDMPPGTPLYGPMSVVSDDSDPSDLLHEGFRGFESGEGKAVAYYVMEGGHVRLSVNPLFESMLMSMTDALSLLEHHRMLPIFLWGCLFTPFSQRKLYGRLSQAIFSAASPVGEVTMDLECLGRKGEPFWGRTSVRHVVEDEGAYASCIISIELLRVDEICPSYSPLHAARPVMDRNRRSSNVNSEKDVSEMYPDNTTGPVATTAFTGSKASFRDVMGHGWDKNLGGVGDSIVGSAASLRGREQLRNDHKHRPLTRRRHKRKCQDMNGPGNGTELDWEGLGISHGHDGGSLWREPGGENSHFYVSEPKLAAMTGFQEAHSWQQQPPHQNIVVQSQSSWVQRRQNQTKHQTHQEQKQTLHHYHQLQPHEQDQVWQTQRQQESCHRQQQYQNVPKEYFYNPSSQPPPQQQQQQQQQHAQRSREFEAWQSQQQPSRQPQRQLTDQSQQKRQQDQQLCWQVKEEVATTKSSGETSEGIEEGEHRGAWNCPDGQSAYPHEPSIMEFQTTLLSLAAFSVHGSHMANSPSATTTGKVFRQTSAGLEGAEEQKMVSTDGGETLDFDDLMKCDFDWSILTSSPLVRLSGAPPTPLLTKSPSLVPLSRTNSITTTTTYIPKSSRQPVVNPPLSLHSTVGCLPLYVQNEGSDAESWLTTVV
ncbi:hypothetical protein NSK_001268 [Nannochloropsis salina CCMP1776]|jgi:hypothetical protein|uniref:Uncharacterized protein n=1 Tax=Nannochloropsis salina CCMP1776 TaxID=1027361 RepID=A0A4D9D8K5_9STRA|nr:hypothetical protein NSK_001268 [Nannochloropsis salina CCMP1776]|eukprot:TFJ87922.1 hypothetical protein NSK_001268 [Nannochloropsis salina CCMP1776]